MQKNSLFKEKILQFIDFKGINKAKFYRDTGITRSTLDKKTGLSEENIAKFFATYPEVSPKWLLTGNGPMVLEADAVNGDEENNYALAPIIELAPEASANCLVADVKASAGFGSLMQSKSALENLPAISILNAPYGLNVAFQIEGDSMHNTIRHLDYVAANYVTDLNDLRDGYVYIVIDAQDGPVCKRLYREGDYYQLVSDNPKYPPYKRKPSEILHFFKAFYHSSTDFRNYYDDLRISFNELKARVSALERAARS